MMSGSPPWAKYHPPPKMPDFPITTEPPGPMVSPGAAGAEVAAEPVPGHLRDLEAERRIGVGEEHVLDVRLIDDDHDADWHAPHLRGDLHIAPPVAVDDADERTAAGTAVPVTLPDVPAQPRIGAT